MPLDAMTGRARNVVIANNDFATKAATVLTSPTSFVAGMGLSNILNDRLKMVCRTIGSSVILDLDMGYPVPISLIMLLGHNFTAAARWRIRGARARSGAASDAGGYSFALSDTVYDTRSILASGTARGAYSWTSTMLDHDLTSGTLPAGASFSRASTATYFDFTGTMRTAASGEARFDYDPVTKTARGLLVEPAATNLMLRSEEFDSAIWNKAAASISANVALAPNGAATMDKLVEDSTNNTHRVFQTCGAFSSGAGVTHSLYAKAGERKYLRMLVYDGGAASVIVTFDLQAGTAGTVTTQTGWTSGGAFIVPAGNGIYRCGLINCTKASLTSHTMLLDVCDNAGNATYLGDGVSGLFLWGAQSEVGSVPTSYIPTAGTTATRAADVPTMPTSALPSFNGSAGTLIATSLLSRVNATSGTGIVELSDGTSSNQIVLFRRASAAMAAAVTTSGVVQADFTISSAIPANQASSSAIAFAANDFAACADGGTVSVDAGGTLPAVDRLSIGVMSGNNSLNGWISRITYIASRVSNADLQTLTNPATSADTRAATLAVYAGTEAVQPITLGTGSKTVYVDDQNMRFYAGARVRLSIDSSNYIVGTVTSYDRPSRRLVVSIASVVGSGSAAAVTISREAADLAVWPAVEPFGLTYWGDFRWGGQIDLLGEGYQPPGVHMPGLANGDGQPIYARYLKIEVQDSSLSWLDIGRLVVAAAYQPTINMTWDWRIGWTDPSQRERARGGQIYVDGRKQWRVASLQLANVGRDELLSQVYELRRAVGVRKPFALILDPTDPANLHRLTLWGSIPDQTMDFSNPQFGDYRAALTVEEHF